MARNRNTDILGKPFGATTVGTIWGKGREIKDFDPKVWRYDICGKPMKFDDYGDVQSNFGWEVDHINPVANNGTDDLSNLQPLQWENNRDKSDTYPWYCPKK